MSNSTALVPYEAPPERTLSWEEQVQHIITELASGRSVNSILRNDAGMPVPSTFWTRLYRDDALYEQISRAREFGQHAVLELAKDIALTPIEEEELEEGFVGNNRFFKSKRRDAIAHRRLAVDTLIKVAQMIAPRSYGPKNDPNKDEDVLLDRKAELDAVTARARRIGVDV